MFFIWLMVSYLSGAIPWSVWLGKWWYQSDPRNQSDGNPGTANAFRVAGWRLGVPVLILDFLKSFLPVYLAYWKFGFSDVELFWIALMPMIGHSFSIFLRFQGGRALVALFGIWAGLTLYSIPLVMGTTAILSLFLFKRDEIRTLVIPVILIAYLIFTRAPIWMILLGITQLAIVATRIGIYLGQVQYGKKIG
jgi:glycerol-3-phosphate acyltransferase PlsY